MPRGQGKFTIEAAVYRRGRDRALPGFIGRNTSNEVQNGVYLDLYLKLKKTGKTSGCSQKGPIFDQLMMMAISHALCWVCSRMWKWCPRQNLTLQKQNSVRVVQTAPFQIRRSVHSPGCALPQGRVAPCDCNPLGGRIAMPYSPMKQAVSVGSLRQCWRHCFRKIMVLCSGFYRLR